MTYVRMTQSVRRRGGSIAEQGAGEQVYDFDLHPKHSQEHEYVWCTFIREEVCGDRGEKYCRHTETLWPSTHSRRKVSANCCFNC